MAKKYVMNFIKKYLGGRRAGCGDALTVAATRGGGTRSDRAINVGDPEYRLPLNADSEAMSKSTPPELISTEDISSL